MKILGVIPARFGSTRFPGKPLALVAGKPLLQWVIEGAKTSKKLTDVWVATDQEDIFALAEKCGARAVMTESELPSGSDRVWAAIKDADCQVAVNIQGDEPFTDRESLAGVLKVFKDDTKSEIDLASLMVRINDWDEINDPNTVKVIVDNRNFALYFSRSPIPYPRDTTIEDLYYKHKGIYAFRKRALMDFQRLPMKPLEAKEKIEAIRYLEYGKKIKMVETNISGIEIDTPEDLKKAQDAWK